MIDQSFKLLLDDTIKNYDSLIRSHNISNCSINRKIFVELVSFYRFVSMACYSFGYISLNDFNRYHMLIRNRITKLENEYRRVRQYE